MGTSDGTVKIRVDPAELDRWKAYAVEHAVSLSTLIRDSVERRVTDAAIRSRPVVSPPAPGPRSFPVDPRPRVVASVRAPVPCSKAARHRAGVFCRYCQQTP